MEIARVGNHLLSVCPYCDNLFDITVANDEVPDAADKLQQLYRNHLRNIPPCRAKAEAEPSLEEILDDLRPMFAAADNERRARIAEHPDNGKKGYWRVIGIRHDATAQACTAMEAIEKCEKAGKVGTWESPEAEFIGEILPEVF